MAVYPGWPFLVYDGPFLREVHTSLLCVMRSVQKNNTDLHCIYLMIQQPQDRKISKVAFLNLLFSFHLSFPSSFFFFSHFRSLEICPICPPLRSKSNGI